MKTIRAAAALLLCLLLSLSLAAPALAAGPAPCGLRVLVDGRETTVRAYSESYEGNLYLSLSDLSRALDGTSKRFRAVYESSAGDGELWRVTTGQSAAPETKGAAATGSGAAVSLALQRNRLFVDGGERRYYSYRADDKELYLSLADVQLMLDLTALPLEDGGLRLLPEQPFAPDLDELRAEGYFTAFNAVLVGDLDTGEILFSGNRTRPYPIASLSKLMTYWLLAEAVEAGAASWSDAVTVSARAAALSRTADGIVKLDEGQVVSLRELTGCMLLASSNECALAAAEYLAGSEERFVELMNESARELGLRSARFYTVHGLPSYSRSGLPAKRQNGMSATDLFRLSALLLRRWPEVTEITSRQFMRFDQLQYTTANSNPLVFNLPGVTGLKTGSTNRAGYCLVATLPVTAGGETHTLAAVVLGAESADLRGQCAEILLRAARDHYEAEGFAQADLP